MIIHDYRLQTAQYIVGHCGKVHVHGLIHNESYDEELNSELEDDLMEEGPPVQNPVPVAIHFAGDDFTRPSIPVYEVDDDFLKEHGDAIVAAFTEDEMLEADYMTLVTARGFLIKYPTSFVATQEKCFSGCDLDDDFVQTAYLSNRDDDIVLVTNQGNAFIFKDSIIPEVEEIGDPLGFQTNVINRESIFAHIIVATPVSDDSEIIVTTDKGYLRSVNLSKAFRIEHHAWCCFPLWRQTGAKQIPVSNKWGHLADGGLIRENDTVNVYSTEGVNLARVRFALGEGETRLIPSDAFASIGLPKKERVFGLEKIEGEEAEFLPEEFCE